MGRGRKARLTLTMLLVGGALAALQCGCNPSQAELERLRKESEELQERVERLERENRQLRGQPVTAEEVYAYFADDGPRGTLAGLLPGDQLEDARARFGEETRTRSWTSEGRPVVQYEWELEGGVILRLNADEDGRLGRIAVVFADPQGLHLPTLAGLVLGQETFSSVREKFGDNLTADPQLWGARGLYTVAQRTVLPGGRRRLEFIYQMPAGVSRGQLERIGEELQHRRDPAVLDPYLHDRAPFMVALAEVR